MQWPCTAAPWPPSDPVRAPPCAARRAPLLKCRGTTVVLHPAARDVCADVRRRAGDGSLPRPRTKRLARLASSFPRPSDPCFLTLTQRTGRRRVSLDRPPACSVLATELNTASSAAPRHDLHRRDICQTSDDSATPTAPCTEHTPTISSRPSDTTLLCSAARPTSQSQLLLRPYYSPPPPVFLQHHPQR